MAIINENDTTEIIIDETTYKIYTEDRPFTLPPIGSIVKPNDNWRGLHLLPHYADRTGKITGYTMNESRILCYIVPGIASTEIKWRYKFVDVIKYPDDVRI